MTMPTWFFEAMSIMFLKLYRFLFLIIMRRTNMWTKPEVTEMRFGFEVTMYVCNR